MAAKSKKSELIWFSLADRSFLVKSGEVSVINHQCLFLPCHFCLSVVTES